MSDTERATGTSDPQYGLVSVLYHSLQSGEILQSYVDDARRAGDAELADFLQRVQQEDRNRAGDAKRLLAGRLQLAAR